MHFLTLRPNLAGGAPVGALNVEELGDSRGREPLSFQVIGFTALPDGTFRPVSKSSTGRMDIFRHDVVLRCPADSARSGRPQKMGLLQIGCLTSEDLPDCAVSAGPLLECADFAAHPVNSDPSLGSRPPFADRPMARMALYGGRDGRTHLRLFDGRPGSAVFPGVTPAAARDAIADDPGYRWGCFLDPGQTAKLWVDSGQGTVGFGNRHYLQWPADPAEAFRWIPDSGRLVASYISLRQPAAATRCP